MHVPFAVALLCAVAARANYISTGWQPGQPTAKPLPRSAFSGFNPNAPRAAEQAAAGETAKSSGSFFKDMFTSGPIGEFLEKSGINVTAAIERANANGWDPRIPLINDHNYKDLVVNEELTPEEEDQRVWFILVTAAQGANNAVSQYVDKEYDLAFNITQDTGDLDHVRWARVDYMDVTYLTTKWSVWKPPVLVVLKDRGKTLRFYYTSTLVIRGQAMHDFLAIDGWKETQPWSTAWAPGGNREHILEFIAVWSAFIYRYISMVPKFVLLLATGAVTSVMVSFLHRNDPKVQVKPAEVAPAPKPIEAVEAAPKEAEKPKKSSPKKRKGGK